MVWFSRTSTLPLVAEESEKFEDSKSLAFFFPMLSQPPKRT